VPLVEDPVYPGRLERGERKVRDVLLVREELVLSSHVDRLCVARRVHYFGSDIVYEDRGRSALAEESEEA
jgi:hypothetical protein